MFPSFPLEPTYFIDNNIQGLDPEMLKNDGIKGLILDLDNTIMRPKAGCFCDVVLPWLEKAQSLDLKLIVVTNNTNDKYIQQVIPVLQKINIPMIAKARKPRRGKLREALAQINLAPEDVCIIGDRVLTDVLGGIRLNMKTAFVRPLLGKNENFLFRLLRETELLLLKQI